MRKLPIERGTQWERQPWKLSMTRGAIVWALPLDKSCSACLHQKNMSEAEENGAAVSWCYYTHWTAEDQVPARANDRMPCSNSHSISNLTIEMQIIEVTFLPGIYFLPLLTSSITREAIIRDIGEVAIEGLRHTHSQGHLTVAGKVAAVWTRNLL